MKPQIITGGTGLLGQELIRQLQNDGSYRILCLSRNAPNTHNKANKVDYILGDILNYPKLLEAIEGVDIVIHTAAMVSFNRKDTAKLYEINVTGTENVVNACLEKKTKKLIHISSVAAIGKPEIKLPAGEILTVDENTKWVNSPNHSEYGKSKHLAELEVYRGQAEGLNTIIINPSVILGEADWTKSSTRLFKYIYDKNLFYTEGYINYVDVRDVSKMILKLTKSDLSGERFIANSGSTSFKEFFTTIASSFKVKPPSIKIGKIGSEILWRIESLRSFITGSDPLITKDTSVTAQRRIYFDNSKSKAMLEIEFTELETTVKRVSNYLMPS